MDDLTKDRLIQDYLNGTLTTDTKLLFEKQLDEDAEFAAEVKELEDLETGLHSIGLDMLKEEVNNWEQEFKEKSKPKTKLIQLWPKYTAVAASVILLIVAGLFVYNGTPDNNELYAEYFDPYEDMILTRGDISNSESLLIAGMEAYNNEEFTTASEKLNDYLLNNNENKGVALYLGIAQMQIGKYSEAAISFGLAQQDVKFKQQAQWYEALLYVKSNQTEKARSLLEIIGKNTDHYQSENAQSILNELN